MMLLPSSLGAELSLYDEVITLLHLLWACENLKHKRYV